MRQTAAEIDHAIVDVAAGIFAAHTYARSSVQQIADAVGYSKPGLLHRFGSKADLHRAALAEVDETVQHLVAQATLLRGDPRQVETVLTMIATRALARPGMVQLMLTAFDPGSREPGTEGLQAAGLRLVEVFDIPTSSTVARLRVTLALRLIGMAATSQATGGSELRVPQETLLPLVVDLAAYVLAGRSGDAEA